jgi:hypothetical protein
VNKLRLEVLSVVLGVIAALAVVSSTQNYQSAPAPPAFLGGRVAKTDLNEVATATVKSPAQSLTENATVRDKIPVQSLPFVWLALPLFAAALIYRVANRILDGKELSS